MQKTKHNISQKIIQVLADYRARMILFSIIEKEKTADDLSYDLRIPLSTVYSKLHKLDELSLVRVRRDPIERGNPDKIYKSKISEAHIIITKPEPKLDLKPNKSKKQSKKE